MGDQRKKNDDRCFDTYDCVPGRQGWEKFEQDVFGYGSQSNEYGDSPYSSSIADMWPHSSEPVSDSKQ